MSNSVKFEKEMIDLEIKWNKKSYRWWTLWTAFNIGMILFNIFNIFNGIGKPWIIGWALGTHFMVLLFSISEIFLAVIEKKELMRKKSHLEEYELRDREIYLGQMHSIQNTSAFPY